MTGGAQDVVGKGNVIFVRLLVCISSAIGPAPAARVRS
jgi:hypothetical protein